MLTKRTTFTLNTIDYSFSMRAARFYIFLLCFYFFRQYIYIYRNIRVVYLFGFCPELSKIGLSTFGTLRSDFVCEFIHNLVYENNVSICGLLKEIVSNVLYKWIVKI